MLERLRLSRATTGRGSAMRFVLLIGVVSLFSDMTHEGARGITGPFLGSLGASAAAVSIIAGAGELLGYVLRFVFGYAADRTHRYWPITIVGYTLQMAVVPLLAVVGSWQAAAVLIIGERTGRAMRTPARDAMLAHATGELGRGWVFGVREALDAFGGMLGPVLVAAVIYLHGGFRPSFAVLAIPAVLTLIVLGVARREYPNPLNLETGEAAPAAHGVPRSFWVYLAAMALVAAAYADYPLIAFHLGESHVVATIWIPILYAVAMATEAVAALALGRLFDRIGLLTVVGATVVTACYAPLVFLGTASLAVIGMVFWGLGMAAQESIVKAAITGMVAPDRRASAYGLFDTGFGIAWFAGSIALGLLYAYSPNALVAFSVTLQALALPLLIWTSHSIPAHP